MENELGEHLLMLLEGRSAHIDFDAAVDGFPLDKINEHPARSPHSAWELLEHIRIAQWDILEFSLNGEHVCPEWPEGYWPDGPGTQPDWQRSIEQVRSDLDRLKQLVRSESTDMFSKIPHGTGQTILREILLVADHNAYHLGQLMLVRKILEA